MSTTSVIKSRPLPGSMRPGDWHPGYFGYEGDPRRWLAPEGEGVVELPEAPEWSALCRELVIGAVDVALGGIDLMMPVERWGGVLPYVDRGDLFCAASNLDDELPMPEVIAAIREAMAFIGLDD